MEHSFDIDMAQNYGIEEAIIFKNIAFWCIKNKANDVNFYEGFYFTRCSNKAFCEIFPYLSKKKIEGALRHLIEENVIIAEHHSANAYDRTLSYALAPNAYIILNYPFWEIEKLILENGKRLSGQSLIRYKQKIKALICDNKEGLQRIGRTPFDPYVRSARAHQETSKLEHFLTVY